MAAFVDLRFTASALALFVGLNAVDAGAQTTPTYATEPEYTINYSLSAIKAAQAYTAGYTGAGVTVAVFDSGIDRTNGDLSAAGKVLAGYDYVANTAGVASAPNGHGTFVAGIIAASRNGWGVEGVAFNASILPERIIDGSGSIGVTDSGLSAAINFGINNGARIFNNSWNSTTLITQVSASAVSGALPTSIPAYQNAVVNKGALFVFAAGNESQAQVGYLAGLPALYSNLKAGWIAAVATDPSGVIASYSNRCGVSAAWCMAAPGSSIYSTYGGGIAVGNGTSFAAPVIAGAAAVLLQEWPYLTAGQVGQILLITANKTGIYADKATYGQGLLDLNAAIQPSGPTLIPTPAPAPAPTPTPTPTPTSGGGKGGGGKPTKRSGEILSVAFGDGFGGKIGPVLVLDQFRRGYLVDGAALVHASAAQFDTRDMMGRFGNEDLVEIAPGVKASFSAGNAASPGFGDRMRTQMTGSDGRVFEVSAGVNPALGFGNLSSETVPADALIVEDGIGNPYLNLTEGGIAARMALPLARSSATTINFGVFEGYSRSQSLETRLGDPSYAPPRVGGATVEAAVAVGQTSRLGFELGAIVEQGAFLGSTASGAFGSSGDTPTAFAGINGETEILPGLRLFGSYHIGQSTPSATPGSLVTSYGTVRTESFAVGLVAEGVARRADHLGLTLSQPLRVVGGNAQLTIPYATDFYGNVLTHNISAPMGADGRELDLQGFYTGHLNGSLKFDAGVVARMQPDNQKSAQTDMIGVVKLKASF